jgi:anaerobic selenocysteine-containing dehydrogenase
VIATNAKHAKSIARNSNWLEIGKVTHAIAFEDYCRDGGDDVQQIFEEYREQYPQMRNIGDWVELEWGT